MASSFLATSRESFNGLGIGIEDDEAAKAAKAAAKEELLWPFMFVSPCPGSLPGSGSCPGSACANSRGAGTLAKVMLQ
ncbi:hypothetical protein [Anabaena catenula]|uniref:Uncharacterized protein n=1 Tax=Anabaena catenula FACHB-362 TaxID=2692877 RepID=A0ABR8J3S8_9NOST|nr:hypothetical protein [Anabaena catenula]MBD2692225.1 hypothetical protein [Anabaena catenula FACHB-362]